MTSINAQRSTSSRQIAGLVFVIFLSLLIPFGIIVASVQSAMSGKPFGDPSAEISYFPGAVKNGEMWHWVRRTLNATGRPLYDFRVKRLDLETGDEYETDIEVTSRPMNPVWLGDELFAYQGLSLFKLEGTRFVDFAQLPVPVSGFFYCLPFLHDRKISTIVETAQNNYQLVQFIDGQWCKAGQIQLPFTDRTVFDKPYPADIQFVEQSLPASALFPANSFTENPIRPNLVMYSSRCGLTADRNGPLLYSYSEPFEVGRQDSSGRWQSLEAFNSKEFESGPIVLANPTESTSYLVDTDAWFSSGNIRRIEGNSVGPVHAKIKGTAHEYLARWKQIAIGCFFAWLTHMVILASGFVWLNCHSNPMFAFGAQQVIRASVARRAFAFGIDLAGMIIAGLLAVGALLPFFKIDFGQSSLLSLCNWLFDYEQTIQAVLTGERSEYYGWMERLMNGNYRYLIEPMLLNPTFCGLVLIELVVLLIVKTYVEGRFGITIGKWVTGIRTVQITLRPSGFARSLARNILHSIDFPFLLTPLPGLISILSSQYRQRFGDRVADTIVVRAGSIQPMAMEHESES